MPCKYQNIVKCTKCTYPFYKECSLFVKANTAFHIRKLQPFHFSRQKVTSPSTWSTDINRAKSAAAQYAIKLGTEVTKLSLSQVLSIVIDGADLTGKVYYIEVPNKCSGDTEKITSVLHSFIDKVLFDNGCISLFLSMASNIRLSDIPKI